MKTLAPQSRLCLTFTLILVFLLIGWNTALADSTPFSKIVVFGDSLSDTGNFHRQTGGFPPPPYDAGRFCNGPVWVEYMAADLGMTLAAEDVYAVGGATTGNLNSNDGFLGLRYGGLQDQIATFLAKIAATGADPDALYVIWAGANDVFIGVATRAPADLVIAQGVLNTLRAVQNLRSSGARHILVANVPDLGVIPLAGLLNVRGLLTQFSTEYNRVLTTALDDLAQRGVPTIRVDAFATLHAMATHPADFGFENVTQPFLETGGDPADFLFWDRVHTTTRGHEVFGGEAVQSLVAWFSPRRGQGAPDGLVNGLNGLVRAQP